MITPAAVEHYKSLVSGLGRGGMWALMWAGARFYDNGIPLFVHQEVEVIGINQYRWWWVRATNPSNGEVEEGWVPASYLKVSGEFKAFKEGWV